MNLFTIITYVMLVYMAIRIIYLNRVRKRNAAMTELMQSASEPAVFKEKAARMMEENQKDPAFINELKVFMIWEEALNQRYDEFEENVKNLDMRNYLTAGRKGTGIDEISCFYLMQSIPNILYGNGNTDMIKVLDAKVDEIREDLEPQMVYQISKANTDMYTGTGDAARITYEKILEGDYEEMKYGRNMIGIYKHICSAMLAMYYKDKDEAKYEENRSTLASFEGMNVGKRWLKNIGIEVPKAEEAAEEETQTEEEQQETDGDSKTE